MYIQTIAKPYTYKMTDIFENTILCKNCNKKMEKTIVDKNGFSLRAVECRECGNKIIHPQDLKEYEEFVDLKKKNFQVKLRFVGNSYAVSIPKEIIDFMQEQEKHMKDMVNLCLEEMGRITLNFE
jgi:DNA-directed RNA polymerase subunit RPC12/RpoP